MAYQYPENKVCKVVEADELEGETSDGWNLKEILREEGSDVIDTKYTNTDGGGYGQQYTESIITPKTVHRFLLEKSEESLLADCLVENAKLVKQCGVDQAAVVSSMKDLERSEANLKKSRDYRIKMSSECDQFRHKSNEQNTLLQKMERHLSAVCNAIGTKQFDSIIAELEQKS